MSIAIACEIVYNNIYHKEMEVNIINNSKQERQKDQKDLDDLIFEDEDYYVSER